MPIDPNIKKVLIETISEGRKRKGIAQEGLEAQFYLGKGWINALENGSIVDPPFDLILALIDYLDIDFRNVTSKISFDNPQSLNRLITAQELGENLKCIFKFAKFEAEYVIANASIHSFDTLLKEFRTGINKKNIQKADVILNTFTKAISMFPHVNPSDIWYFIISSIYKDPYNHPITELGKNLDQSWRRAGGWALERIFVNYYKEELAKHDIVIGIFKDESKTELLEKMELNYYVQSNKADVLLINTKNGNYDCFGVIHVKASFAERRSNDQSLSMALRQKQFFSPFMTMDCKAKPSKHPVNKGELGDNVATNKKAQTPKRKEFEKQGYFSACFSFNSNTKPTPAGKATSRIFVMNFSNPNDAFTQMVIQERNRLYGE